MTEYSEKEIALIEHFLPWLMTENEYKNHLPYLLYRDMVNECFMRYPTSNNVFKQSLWNTYLTFHKINIDGSSVYRMTPEWDALIADSVLGTNCHCNLSGELSFVTPKTCCEVCDEFSLP